MTPDSEMIVRMLHLPPEKNRLHNEQSAQSLKEPTAEDEIDNRSVNNSMHMSNRISPRRTEEGHFMPSIPGGWAQTMSMQQHQKLS